MLGVEDLESMVQFNFLINIEYLLIHMFDPNIPITIFHGQRSSPPTFNDQFTNIQVYSPVIKDRYGTHHTKAMLMFFRDQKTGIKTAQLIVMTANLIPPDWEEMTQGVYRSPRCPLKSDSHKVNPNVSYSSLFETDLTKYLCAYQLRPIFKVITQLKLYDWSSCKAILIGSVPGRHKGPELKEWGIGKLSTLLQSHVDPPEPCRSNSQIILQCSSIASTPQKWFDTLCARMSCSKNQLFSKIPKPCVVYPTMETADESITGRYKSGDFLRFEKTTYEKIHGWFDSFLYDWKSAKAGRQRIMPHIKTYTRVYTDVDGQPSIAWHLLTSCNLSRAAWGDYQLQNTQLYIKSFELGVFFCPSLWKDDSGKEVVLRPTTNTEKDDDTRTIVKVRLPFDLPLSRHPIPLQCFTRYEQ
ncbi:tyrosyl-DNA phosphodiesterase I [Pilaira anomala]|nr:tyrosyl-DNA phosphodiesterase I [Pilaira anomala]